MHLALRDRVGEGFALLAGRTPVAAVCYSRYGGLVRITLLHCREAWRGQGHERNLLETALTDMATDLAARSGVVCEAMVISHPEPNELFAEYGFAVVDREIMAAPVGEPPPRPARPRAAQTLHLADSILTMRTWRRGDTRSAGELLRQANADSVDGLIYPELVQERLAILAVDGIVRGSCGRFEPHSSPVVTEPGTGAVIGLAMCTRSSKAAAFIAELAVVPRWQGRGLGRVLLDRALVGLATAGYQQVYLGVTSDNERARRLYLSRGFVPVRQFGSYYMPA